MEKEIHNKRDGDITETRTYEDGKLDSIEHTNERTGEIHQHEVEHGAFGRTQGKTTAVIENEE